MADGRPGTTVPDIYLYDGTGGTLTPGQTDPSITDLYIWDNPAA